MTCAPHASAQPARWGGVFAMTLCVFALIASEFMPISLLTPMAADLHVTEGLAGSGVAVSGAFAVLASLSLARLAGGMDRRTLLLSLTALMAVSGACVALAPNYDLTLTPRFMSQRGLELGTEFRYLLPHGRGGLEFTYLPSDKLALASIGQGDTLETPLQNAMIAAAIANGGTLMQPTLVDRVRASDLSTISETSLRVRRFSGRSLAAPENDAPSRTAAP